MVTSAHQLSCLLFQQPLTVIQIRIEHVREPPSPELLLDLTHQPAIPQPLVHLGGHEAGQFPRARIARLVRGAVVVHLVLLVGVVQHPHVAVLGRLDHLKLEQAAALFAAPVRGRLAPALGLGLEQHRLVHGRPVVPRLPAPETHPPHLALARHLGPRDPHAVSPRQRPLVQLLLHGCPGGNGVALRRRLHRDHGCRAAIAAAASPKEVCLPSAGRAEDHSSRTCGLSLGMVVLQRMGMSSVVGLGVLRVLWGGCWNRPGLDGGRKDGCRSGGGCAGGRGVGIKV
ncbi:hypothetical protein N656DRAFT_354403 [Canariomyces notabilis]|uniref:Uncharacterized protein n=1 Tax=Canariomyces notabilis TaxID=2074819 RepID=A0AAN6T9A8_9PEZI|nr:hypothetical protein N656DRAFT_354403 [Canariomyces arenarius]